MWGLFLVKKRQRPTLPGVTPVPWALAGLTSLFGMGRGGALPPKSPSCLQWYDAFCYVLTVAGKGRERKCAQGEAFGQLVPLGFGIAAFAPAAYQRGGLPRPFNRWPHLGAGFALRCFQRLSLPNMATRRCGWRHNRYTRGWSSPVLSY